MNNRVAIYCRLSEEDKDKKNRTDDSMSIENQKIMLLDYAKKQDWLIYDIYSDDNYSGADRDRPDFNRMISNAKERKFNIILCKTQSRFSRELEMVELYIHNLFPQWGIRFVSIVDNIDTDIVGNKKTRQINGLVNEWYLEDMSESIKSALRTRIKSGYFIGSVAPYGYKNDPEIKGHLIIDDESANIVREIFNMYIDGMGRTQIARTLNLRGVPNPSQYKCQSGIKSKIGGKKLSDKWTDYTIGNILKNEVYIGNLIQGKTYNPTYKSKHTIPAPKDHWVKVEHTHEPIIDMNVWYLASKMLSERTRPCYVTDDIHIFTGKIVCKYCGYNATVAYNKHQRYYRCTRKKFDKNSCQGVTAFESTIKKAVLSELQKIIQKFVDEEKLQDGISIKDEISKKIEYKQIELKNIIKKIDETDMCLKNLYMDKLKGIIKSSQFAVLSEQFEKDKTELIHQQIILESDIQYFIGLKNKQQTKQEIVMNFLKLDCLTRQMVEQLIEKIEIGGTRKNREIIIHWNF